MFFFLKVTRYKIIHFKTISKAVTPPCFELKYNLHPTLYWSITVNYKTYTNLNKTIIIDWHYRNSILQSITSAKNTTYK